MGILSWFAKNSVKEVAEVVTNGLDKLFTSSEEKLKAQMEIEKMLKEFEIKGRELELRERELAVDDRKSARSNTTDAPLKFVVAVFTLLGFTLFMGIQIYFCYLILQKGLSINEFVIMTFSNFSGIFTALLFTLKDYLFGGSTDKSVENKVIENMTKGVK